jgi:LacI family transcriptional regulator
MPRRRKPGLTDVAREAGVSIATVSRALAQPDVVARETLDKIRSVAATLGYVPNRRASALASGRSRTVGLVVPTLSSAIFSTAAQEIQTALYKVGYQLLIASHEYEEAAETAAIAQLLSHGVDGLIVVGGARPQSTLQLIEDAAVPLIQIWEGTDDFDRVAIDNHHAGYVIARHILDLGHERFGVVCGHLRNNDRQRRRVDGIRTALSEAGVKLCNANISEQSLNIAGGRSACTALLELVPRPTAIIGAMDLLAIGALIEAQARGLWVPQDISIAGIDDVEFAGHIFPSLTTVRVPAAEIGRQTAQRMLSILEMTDQPPMHLTLPIELVVRHSTAVPAGGA